jgi:vacuolar-type H+-ATPase subunit H
MEGSVKSLIEAEEEAHKIVSQAEKEKTDKVKDAHQVAEMILNKKKMEYDSLYREEEARVSNRKCDIFVYRIAIQLANSS